MIREPDTPTEVTPRGEELTKKSVFTKIPSIYAMESGLPPIISADQAPLDQSVSLHNSPSLYLVDEVIDQKNSADIICPFLDSF